MDKRRKTLDESLEPIKGGGWDKKREKNRKLLSLIAFAGKLNGIAKIALQDRLNAVSDCN